jgi:hypothetical protein
VKKELEDAEKFYFKTREVINKSKSGHILKMEDLNEERGKEDAKEDEKLRDSHIERLFKQCEDLLTQPGFTLSEQLSVTLKLLNGLQEQTQKHQTQLQSYQYELTQIQSVQQIVPADGKEQEAGGVELTNVDTTEQDETNNKATKGEDQV